MPGQTEAEVVSNRVAEIQSRPKHEDALPMAVSLKPH